LTVAPAPCAARSKLNRPEPCAAVPTRQARELSSSMRCTALPQASRASAGGCAMMGSECTCQSCAAPPMLATRKGQRSDVSYHSASRASSRYLRRTKASPVTEWLRALARLAHEECGGHGVGAIGMCGTTVLNTLRGMLGPLQTYPD